VLSVAVLAFAIRRREPLVARMYTYGASSTMMPPSPKVPLPVAMKSSLIWIFWVQVGGTPHAHASPRHC